MGEILFSIIPGPIPFNGRLFYRKGEHSFDVEPQPEWFATVVVNYLELAFDESKIVLCVWGYCPYTLGEKVRLSPPERCRGKLVISSNVEWMRGCGRRLVDGKGWWPRYFDPKIGWVCLGNPKFVSGEVVEFAPDCVAVLDAGRLRAIWLRPVVIE